MNYHSAQHLKSEAGIFGKPDSLISLPRVNVVVTCFNYGRFIDHALDSVAAQTYGNFSCVVVDDASTDNSIETAESWISSRKDDRFKLIRNEKNLGQMGSFAAGLAVTEGEFVAFLDADDVWFPDFLRNHIEVHLNRVQTAAASSSDLIQIDAEGRVLAGSTMPPVFTNKRSRTRENPISEKDIPGIGGLEPQSSIEAIYVGSDFGRWHWSMTSGMVFRRPMVELLIPANTDGLRLGADIYLIVLSHYFTGSFVVRNALGAYRRHGMNQFSSLPVSGAPGSAPISKVIANAQNAYRAMFEHLLTANQRISSVLTPASTRKCARSLFRYLLLQEIVIEDPRLNALIGRRRMMQDRILAKTGFLRRQLRRKPK
jgi:glycosyltransferase involved in cell wall biosynthesis